MFCLTFSLLQNSTTIVEFENYFINIIRMFNSPTINLTCTTAINYLRTKIRDRDPGDLGYINYDSFESKEDIERATNIELLLKFDDNQIQTVKALKQSSKFQSYFENILSSNTKILHKYDITNNKNPFFSPNLIKIIMNYIYVLPMWTGIMLNLKTENFSQYKVKKRTTNNPVENHFDFDKNKLLFGKLKVKPSEFVAPKYRFLLSKFISYYINDFAKKKKFKKQIIDEVEKWKINKDFKRTESFYFQNIANFDSRVAYKLSILDSINLEIENEDTNQKEADDENSNYLMLISKFLKF